MMERSKFEFKTQVRVRNYEVDWQGIVHNANYLLYCELGRIEYLKQLGARVDMNTIRGDSKVVVVRNEIDYKSPAIFDEELNVYTRTSSINNSSFVMEGMVEKASSGEIVAENIAYHVWLDPSTDRPKPVPDEFRKLVQAFEGAHCEIFWPKVEV